MWCFHSDKGVKVDLGIPHELWDKPSAEVTDLKNKVCKFFLKRVVKIDEQGPSFSSSSLAGHAVVPQGAICGSASIGGSARPTPLMKLMMVLAGAPGPLPAAGRAPPPAAGSGVGWALREEMPGAVLVAARRALVVPREAHAEQGASAMCSVISYLL